MGISLELAKSNARPLVGARTLMLLSAVLYALTWVLLPLAANTTLNRDTIQIVYWGMEWQAGFHKHPPLISWLSEAALRLFGVSDAVVYGLSAAVMLVSFVLVHRLARRFLNPMGAALAVVTLPVMGYFSYIVPHFNHNILLMPFWALTILAAHLAIAERRFWAWPLLGMAIGLGILAKYTILILPLVLLVHVCLVREHRWVLRSPGAWLAVAITFAVAAPHVHWLLSNNLGPLRYFVGGAGLGDETFLERHLVNPFAALGIMAGMAAPAVAAMMIGLGLPRRRGTPNAPERLLADLTLGPVLMVVLLSAVSGGAMRVEWASSFFLTLPLLLLRRFYGDLAPAAVNRLSAVTSGLSVAMAVTYVLIFTGRVDLDEARWARFPAKPLAAAASEGWHRVCDGPVPVVIADAWLGGTAAFRLRERPRVFTEADPRMAPWLNDSDIGRSGALVLWDRSADGRYRDIDHQDPPRPGEPLDWFPGIEALRARFGEVVELPDVTIDYPGPIPQEPVRIGRAVIPPATPCR